MGLFKYHGGKSSRSHRQQCKWIVGLLPTPITKQFYCEPFCGMLGVLINRPKVHTEIANDKSERIMDLWTVLRDQPDELHRRLTLTLRHENQFHWAVENVDQLKGIDRAVAVAILITQSLEHTAHGKRFGKEWKASFDGGGDFPIPNLGNLYSIHERIRKVHFHCDDALNIIDKVKDQKDYVVYCDPPYAGTLTSVYGAGNEVEHGALMECIRDSKAKVAISGYGDTYDDLGWIRNEKNVIFSSMGKSKVSSNRTEVLWTNYEPRKTNYQPTLF